MISLEIQINHVRNLRAKEMKEHNEECDALNAKLKDTTNELEDLRQKEVLESDLETATSELNDMRQENEALKNQSSRT